MTYMVWVNQKFMVTVETDGSMAAAEHVILDNYQGIVSAQAFDRAALHTNFFVDVLQNSKTISLDELKAMSDRYENAYIELAKKQEDEEAMKNEIEQLQEIIERKKAELNTKHFSTRKAHLEAINAKNALNCIEH